MNDPGLHEPTQQAADAVEKRTEDEEDEIEREENEFLDPRYLSNS